MKKVIFTVFAHPDDESFGPSGTLIKEIRENGTDVHLITITSGQSGVNPDNYTDLGAARLKEWHEAARIIGASSTHYLGYTDGMLSNDSYLTILPKLSAIIDEMLAGYQEPIEVEFMTNDLNGITGHIDHIVAARTACQTFYTRKLDDERFRRIRLACLPKTRLAQHDLSWLYMEAGRDEDEIGEVSDARAYRDDIIACMRAHHSQRQDCETHLATRGDSIGLDYFIVKE